MAYFIFTLGFGLPVSGSRASGPSCLENQLGPLPPAATNPFAFIAICPMLLLIGVLFVGNDDDMKAFRS